MRLLKAFLPLILITAALVAGAYYVNTDSFQQFLGHDTTSTDSNSSDAAGTTTTSSDGSTNYNTATGQISSGEVDGIPAYSSSPYIEINNNVPAFSQDDVNRGSFEDYSQLDALGRCGAAFALIEKDKMPGDTPRGDIDDVKPTGYSYATYDFIEGGVLYNRCHLIGYQLTGQNDNPLNLITGTRYFNTAGMEYWEDKVASYVRRWGKPVLYRVTPIYSGDNLVASGVQIEAMSAEDNGDALSFNVYCYNVQPRIGIDYATGNNWLAVDDANPNEQASDFVVNSKTRYFHVPGCSYITSVEPESSADYHGKRTDLTLQGFEPCKTCNP